LGFEVEVRVVDEESGLREAVVKIRGKIVAVVPFKDEDSLKRILDGVKVIRSR
jgi:hypothetical protein